MVVILKYLTLLQWDRSSEIDPKFSGWNHFWSLQSSRSWGKGHVFKNQQNDHNWKFEKEETLHFCKWTVSRWRLLLQCPLKLSSESMVGRLKWLTSFTSFTKLSDQRTHVKSLVTVLLAHFPMYKTQKKVKNGGKIVNCSSWRSTLYFSVVENSSQERQKLHHFCFWHARHCLLFVLCCFSKH